MGKVKGSLCRTRNTSSSLFCVRVFLITVRNAPMTKCSHYSQTAYCLEGKRDRVTKILFEIWVGGRECMHGVCEISGDEP